MNGNDGSYVPLHTSVRLQGCLFDIANIHMTSRCAYVEVYKDSQPPTLGPFGPKCNSKFEILIIEIFSPKQKLLCLKV